MSARILTYCIMTSASSAAALDRRFPGPDYWLDRDVEIPSNGYLLHAWTEQGAVFGNFAVDLQGGAACARQFRLVYTGGTFPKPPRWMYRATVIVPAGIVHGTRTIHLFERWASAPDDVAEDA